MLFFNFCKTDAILLTTGKTVTNYLFFRNPRHLTVDIPYLIRKDRPKQQQMCYILLKQIDLSYIYM